MADLRLVRIIPGCALLLMAILFSSCGDSTVTVTQTVATKSASTATGARTGTQDLALGSSLTLDTAVSSEENDSPQYKLDIKKPVLKGSTDERVERFNEAVNMLYSEQMTDFVQTATDYGPAPVPTGTGSGLTLDFEQKSPDGAIISISVKNVSYFEGAAHPNSVFSTLNFDLTTGSTLSLQQMFLPGKQYLDILADYCQQELTKRGTLSWPQGADPTEENYQNWALTADGIEITFDDGQVASHAEGPQVVLVPYDNLQQSLDWQGPLEQIRP